MEDGLDLYAEAPDPKRPAVCFDESPVSRLGSKPSSNHEIPSQKSSCPLKANSCPQGDFLSRRPQL
jgi:hypothetical protein